MKKILFICHGNICRSPMAEAIFKNMIKTSGLPEDDYLIDSAATSREEIGNDIYPPAKRCMDAHGIPYQSRAAHQLTPGDYAKYDYLICMDENNMRNLKHIITGDPNHKISKLLDWAHPDYVHGRKKDVADPWYTGDFEQTYQDIVVGCKGFLDSFIEIEPGRYRHYKGNEYEVLGMAKHSENLEALVIYRALYGEGKVWARPATMWLEKVIVDGKEVPRFQRIYQ